MLNKNEVFLLRFNQLGSEIIKGRDLNNSLQKVLETARKLLNFDRVYLFAPSRRKDLLEVLMAVGKHSFIAKSLKWPKNSMGGPTYVLKTSRSLLQRGLLDRRAAAYYPQKETDREVLFAIYKLGHFGAGDILLVPVLFRGRTVAVLGADRLQKKLRAADQNNLEQFASQIGWAIENARLRRENELMLKDLAKLVDKRTQEIKDIQAQLIHSERLAAMGELVAGITHEIKNPLAGIAGFTELLRGFLRGDAGALQVLDGLETSVGHLQNIVRNFLAFAKKTRADLQKVAVNQVVADALALTNYNLRRRGIQIDARLAADLPEITGDKNQLVQVLTNIILNAEHAMADGGRLRISTRFRNNKIRIEIADNGIGIAPENLGSIFQAFFTTKASDKGTGLGLSVSNNIIKAHRGRISVRSAVGKGSTFSISLPV
ncbi:MAG: GAF domain-containing protein [Candidatus Margulisbacteria bacterium]|jgi:signal transduction histidine kinase|nr:GAF domain-containing protein [Candidatus Margulisiibacteriota bacterium]